MTRPRIFVVNLPADADGTPRVSMKPAEFFGQVVYITPLGSRPPPDPMDSVPTIERAMADYTVADFLVLVGEMDLIALAAAFAMQATGGVVNFLKWDRNHRAYFPYKATLPQLFTDDEPDACATIDDLRRF